MKSDTETRSMRGQRGGHGERRRRRTRRKSPDDSETKKPVKQSIDVGGEETDESRSSSRSESEASSPEDRTDSPAGREELIALGRETYDKNCASCHGADREGSTFAYPALTNLSERLSREETRRVIENGPGSMPAFNQLSDQKKDALVEFLHK